ncbi:MAG: Sensor protein ZraS [candidate division WS2 bacterium]|nr:Sensor protein ZraS [Candidatus Lithacetigena glycinireducens]
MLEFYKEKSLQVANITAQHVTDSMLEKNPLEVGRRINELSRFGEVKIGVAGADGLQAFNTDIPIPGEVFNVHRETHVAYRDEIIFYKPLENEFRCHACHNPQDETRGMIVIKTSIKKALTEINETAKRLIIFAVLIGFLSEIFLIIVLRKMILKPIEILNKGAEILKSGKLNYRIELKKSDEIGSLASCFNEMAESIEKSHINLDNAVRQKTKELSVIAELSSHVFRGDRTLREIVEQFLNAILNQMGYDYSSLCLIDKETGLLLQEFKAGISNGFCASELPLAGDHPFIKIIREAKPSLKKAADIGAPDSFGNIIIVPILSHQRKRCREVNHCTYENCPAFENQDDRCWLIANTLCRSPQAVAGKEKIYGCLRCDVFPVLGVLVTGKKEEITKTSLHSLEILASEIASAIENQRLIEGKKEDISSLIKLHNISIEAIRDLNLHTLTQSIVSSATVFANMDAAILWLMERDGRLHIGTVSNIEKELLPDSLPVEESFIGRSIAEERPIETIRIQDVECLSDLTQKYGFLYMASIPLKLKDSIFGCLTLFKKRGFFMTDAEKAVVQLFASQATAAINTAQIYNELTMEKEFSDAVFSNMAMGIMVFDREDRIIRSNPAAFNILKINDSIIGRRLKDVLPQASDFLVIDAAFDREVEIPAGTETIPVGFSNSSFLDMNGEKTGTIVVFRDLTELKKLQAEIRKKQHFEAIGKVIAGVAHEIRNPLFGISSIVQILEREIKSEKHNALLQAVLKEIYRLKSLLEGLLLYSRPSKPHIRELDLNVLMEKIKHYVEAKKEEVKVNLIINPSVTIKADMDKLTQVFMNLIDNALNAGSRNIDIAVEKRKDRVIITTKDDGIGIRKDIIDKIFDPFFTTRKEGTGLGLSICKKIIEDHNGSMEIQSAEGSGTSVILTMPQQ